MPQFIDTLPLKADPVFTGVDSVDQDMLYRRPSGAGDWLVILTTSGIAEVVHPDISLEQRRGDVVLFAPHTPLEYVGRCVSGWERKWALFAPRAHWLEWLVWPEVAAGLMQLPRLTEAVMAQVEPALALTHRYARAGMRQRGAFALNALETALLHFDAVNPQADGAQLDHRVERVLTHIGEQLHLPLSLDGLAELASLSEGHLCRLFKEQVGLSPMQCVEERRLQRAAELLQLTPRRIQEIAAAVGYEEAFYFSNRFRRMMGVSPRRYREQGGTERTRRPTQA